MTVSRRRANLAAVTLAIAGVIGLTACGSDDDEGSADTTTSPANTQLTAPPVTTAPPTTAPPATAAPSTAAPATAAPSTAAPPTAAPTTVPSTEAVSNEITITATVGVDTDPTRVEVVPLGATVTLVLTNPDSHDEFHVHGYELGDGEEVEPGVAKTFIFTVDQAGEFAVESHENDSVLLTLNVK